MAKLFKRVVRDTLPVMSGYLVLGVGFGLVMKSMGFEPFWGPAMSVCIFAGSLQFVAADLLVANTPLLTVALVTILVNARHLFYGISMIDRYRNTGIKKIYLMFALTDETYSLLCNYDKTGNANQDGKYYLAVTLADHIYWVGGTLLGVLAGEIIPFSTEGVEFALTALFVTVVTDQWLKTKHHFPAIAGAVISVVCLLIFGAEKFLIPTLFIILAVLLFYRKFEPAEEESHE